MSKKKSAKITAGLRNSFRDGTSKLANRLYCGYKQDERGELTVNEPEAAIADKIFTHYLDEASLGLIADYFSELKILSLAGKPK